MCELINLRCVFLRVVYKKSWGGVLGEGPDCGVFWSWTGNKKCLRKQISDMKTNKAKESPFTSFFLKKIDF